MSAQTTTAQGNNFAAHQLIACATTAVFFGATFTTLIPATMLAFISQQIAEPAPSDKMRNPARSNGQNVRKSLTAEATLLIPPTRKYPLTHNLTTDATV